VRVALDAQLAVGTATGIGEYARGLSGALRDAGIDVVTLARTSFDPWRFDRRVVWDQLLMPLAARGARADLLHCASGTMPLVRPAPIVVTVHDVAWLRVQAHARPYARYYFGGLALHQYQHARRVLVDSAFSAHELTALGAIDPSRIDVVYPGVAADIAAIARRPDANPFVLVAATVEPRKNLAVVIRALPDLPNLRLVSTGPTTPYRAECERLAHALGVASRVEFRGYVPRPELLDLYARAAAVAVPSIYEGFGYGAAWALCAGTPLVAANTSSLPEVVGAWAPLLPPHDVSAWTAALTAILQDRAAAEHRAAAARPAAILRFAWPTAAKSAIESYRRALPAS
jgi:glycosyltransferase involved in cell wall biosynthesis